MNQHQILSGLKAKGYEPALTNKAYVIMTRPVGAEHTGQVVFADGTIKTLRSVDAVRATNNEEINMPTYYTKKQLEKMTEKERTALYNKSTGSNVTRMRNKDKAVKDILTAQTCDKAAELGVKNKQPKKQGIAATLLAMLKKSSVGLTAEQASHLIGGKVISIKLAVSHIRTGRVDGKKHTVNLDRKTGIYTYESN